MTTELLVRLKYEIITRDATTWHLCDTYPLSVVQAWAWRCAKDVEHLANNYPAALECIKVSNDYKNGKATKTQLSFACSTSNSGRTVNNANAVNAAYSAYYAANITSYSRSHAAYSAYYACTHAATHHAKFTLYIGWLIEELIKWESNV